jgi:heme oxygenase
MYSPEAWTGPAAHGPAAPSRRFALKTATDTAHQHVETIIRAAGMFDTVAGYKRYLRASWRLRVQHEEQLDRCGAAEVWPEWPGRRIASLVAQDLVDVGLSPAQPPPQLDANLSRSELLATLYVLEGSSLGARVLVRLVSVLGLSATCGARHLQAQAGDTTSWRSFVTTLETAPVAPCHDMACTVFDRFAAAYQQAHA